MKYSMRFLPLLVVLLLQAGCALLPHQKTSTPVSSIPLSDPSPSKKPWHLLPHLSLPHIPLKLPFFHHKPPPPRAEALQRVGTIRTLSTDRSFVIISQEPGVPISMGRDLIVTAGTGEPIRLRAAESQPPYFIADIKSGHPAAGQTVFQ